MIHILLTGGGTGGHIYPLCAVSDALREYIPKDKLSLTYCGPQHPLNKEFIARNITVYPILSSKFRRYFDIQNIFDIPKFFISLFQCLLRLYILMPDIVFSKGGSGAFPVVLVARWYRIPVIIHESDAIPGLTNRLSSHYADRIAIAFRGATSFFPEKKIAFVGNPIRKALYESHIATTIAKERIGCDPKIPVILVLGGSQGSQRINTLILNGLQEFLNIAQVYHQTGEGNVQEVKILAEITLASFSKQLRERYHATGTFDLFSLRDVMQAADIIISRAGAGAIYEIASFGKPAILIPLQGSANDHQKANAYEYEHAGAAEVIEEKNMSPNLVLLQIKEILENPEKQRVIAEAAKMFFKPNAADTIAREILFLIKKKVIEIK